MNAKPIKIRRALISVSDKTGLEELCRQLAAHKVEILSSGGTARHIASLNIEVKDVSAYTGAPEMLDGRVKTLHPKIHAGLLAIRDNPQHMDQLKTQGYPPIDLVVVNLYPFEKASRDKKLSEEAVTEQIDIGGPSLLRGAAKNWPFVTSLVDPSQYKEFLEEFEKNDGGTSLPFRKRAAQRVFERTAEYDSTIASYFQRDVEGLPEHFPLALERKWELRYGENPHQQAGFYLRAGESGATLIEKVLQGKQLSYNNLLDIHGAIDLILEFEREIAVAVLKHTNPCGVAVSSTSLTEAYDRALACDPVSAFGGIVICSRPIDAETAGRISTTFTEIVLAPKIDPKAQEVFARKKNLRVLEVDLEHAREALGGMDIRRAADGYLVQQRDLSTEALDHAKVATRRSPTEPEMRALTFAWKVAKHVKSNAIVITNEHQTLGIGAGQMSRVDSTRFAVLKAGAEKIRGAVLASDAFFPFRDSIDEMAKHGIRAIVQPGGSIRDEEIIAAADEAEMTMLFTGVRHFRH